MYEKLQKHLHLELQYIKNNLSLRTKTDHVLNQ